VGSRQGHLCGVKMYSHQNQILMKKLLLATLTMFMLFSIIPVQLQAGVETRSVPATPAPPVPAEVTVMLNRLDEIKAMDMSALGKVEKKELRKEVKMIRSDLRAAGQGVYLSVGAIIIIILLLILLL